MFDIFSIVHSIAKPSKYFPVWILFRYVARNIVHGGSVEEKTVILKKVIQLLFEQLFCSKFAFEI